MNELMIPLDTKSLTPLYQQIEEYLKQEIQEGRLVAGMRLPSSRAAFSKSSSQPKYPWNAYDQLVAEGYIEPVAYKGYYVCEIEGIYFQKAEYTETKQSRKDRDKTEKKITEISLRFCTKWNCTGKFSDSYLETAGKTGVKWFYRRNFCTGKSLWRRFFQRSYCRVPVSCQRSKVWKESDFSWSRKWLSAYGFGYPFWM